MVFQSFNLWSHMSVLENVMEAPLHVQKRDRAEVEAEAIEMLRKVGIAERPKPTPPSFPAASSSAPRSPGPSASTRRLMLFDEPTRALDPELEAKSCESSSSSPTRDGP